MDSHLHGNNDYKTLKFILLTTIINIKECEKITKAFSKYFKFIKPAAMLFKVKALNNSELPVKVVAAVSKGEKG
jgi:hypothetical protein